MSENVVHVSVFGTSSTQTLGLKSSCSVTLDLHGLHAF